MGDNSQVRQLEADVRIMSPHDEFLTMFPRKSIRELNTTGEVNNLFTI